MNALVIDTSTDAVAISVGTANDDSTSRCVSQQSSHSENILVAIQEVLDERELSIKQINAVGVGVGPGLFTGLRVGITAAHAFAQALGIPLVYFSSIELTALSSANLSENETPSILVARDARRHELYFAQYSCEKISPTEQTIDTTTFSTCLTRINNEGLISPAEFVQLANENFSSDIVVDDLTKYEEFQSLSSQARSRVVTAIIDAGVMIDHVINSVDDAITADVFAPSALYIRKSDAELSWGTPK